MVTAVRSPGFVPGLCILPGRAKDGTGRLCGHTMGNIEQRFWVFLVFRGRGIGWISLGSCPLLLTVASIGDMAVEPVDEAAFCGASSNFKAGVVTGGAKSPPPQCVEPDVQRPPTATFTPSESSSLPPTPRSKSKPAKFPLKASIFSAAETNDASAGSLCMLSTTRSGVTILKFFLELKFLIT